LIRPPQPDVMTGVGVVPGVGVGSSVADGEGVRVALGVEVKVATGAGVGLAVAAAVGVEVGLGDWPASKRTSAMVLAARFRRKVVFKPCGVIR
jgi:hypothetical protein